MAGTINGMNGGRRPPLDRYLSPYKLKEKRFRMRFEKEAIKKRKKHSPLLENVRGLIFDVCKF